ncbi:MAG: hypothetical protein QGG71_11750, partial [Pirellulaceae bacterium]|nr:hypothetical protein [Pirellulaceae bacterium]
MNRCGIFCGIAGLLFFACFGVAICTMDIDALDAQEATSPPTPPQTPSETADPFTTADPFETTGDISAALNRKGEWDFVDTPLEDIIAFIRSSSKTALSENRLGYAAMLIRVSASWVIFGG